MKEFPKALYKGKDFTTVNDANQEAVKRANGWLGYGEKAPESQGVELDKKATPVHFSSEQAAQQPTDQLVSNQTPVEASPVDDKEALLAEAKSLGIPANATWGIDAIKKNIDTKKAEQAAQQPTAE